MYKPLLVADLRIYMLFYAWITTCIACNPKAELKIDNDEPNIDSLINVVRVNEKTRVISFGADAITAINTERGIVLIDAGISPGLTARYIKRIEAEFKSNHFAYMINTHGHYDHTGGGKAFGSVRMVCQENVLQEIAEQKNNPEKRILNLKRIADSYDLQLQKSKPHTKEWNELFTQKIRYQNAYLDVVKDNSTIKPDITFQDSLNMDMEDATFEMFYFGKCHSNSDICIFVPELKILFVGDLFSAYGRPSIMDTVMTDKARWQQAVRWLEQRMFHIEMIIGGHGQILSANDLRSFNSNIMGKCASE